MTITDAYDGTISDTSATVTLGAGGAIATITATPGTLFTAPVVTVTDSTVPGGAGALATATLDPATATGGLPKFVDKLPGLGLPGELPLPGGTDPKNALGQYIPVGVPEPCTYSGQAADCYSIALVEYSEKLSSALPPTKLRGYVQIEPRVLTAA